MANDMLSKYLSTIALAAGCAFFVPAGFTKGASEMILSTTQKAVA